MTIKTKLLKVRKQTDEHKQQDKKRLKYLCAVARTLTIKLNLDGI